MKPSLFYVPITVILFSCTDVANKEAEFYVRGNCEMCKTRIENVASVIPGVKSAKWDVKTQKLKIAYDSTKTNAMDVHKAEASFGHGTDLIAMDTLAHEKLPDCCRVAEE